MIEIRTQIKRMIRIDTVFYIFDGIPAFDDIIIIR
jgi:hypothetical protein